MSRCFVMLAAVGLVWVAGAVEFAKPWYGSLQNESNLPLVPFKIGD